MEAVFNLFTFDSTHAAIKAEKLLLDEKMFNQLISIPPEISATCGLSIKTKPEDFQKVLDIFRGEVIFSGIYKITKNGIKKDIEQITSF